MRFQLTFKCESVMIVGYTEKLHDLAKHAHMYVVMTCKLFSQA